MWPGLELLLSIIAHHPAKSQRTTKVLDVEASDGQKLYPVQNEKKKEHIQGDDRMVVVAFVVIPILISRPAKRASSELKKKQKHELFNGNNK